MSPAAISATPFPSFAEAAEARDRWRSRLFVHAVLISCLILQRFGLNLGSSALFISFPAYLGLVTIALVLGIGTIRPIPMMLYMGFAGWALVVTIGALLFPDARFGLSLSSLIGLLLVYAMATVGPSERFDRRATLEIFVSYARFLSVCGIAQFVLQFAGLKMFAFITMFPPINPISVETQFNFHPLLRYGSSILRSNGFFLLEPSIWSQTLAIAVVTDYFVLGRARWLPLYLVAYLVTFSGTGVMALLLSLPFFAALSARHFARVMALLFAAMVALAVASAAFPDQVGSMMARVDELSYSGSSGYARFVSPFLPIGEFSGETRFLIGYGPGATERYIHHVADSGNSIAKLLTDYGVIGLLGFIVMLFGLLWRREVAMLSILGVVIFFLGGGNLLFAPMLVLLYLLCGWSVARPEPSSTDTAPQQIFGESRPVRGRKIPRTAR